MVRIATIIGRMSAALGALAVIAAPHFELFNITWHNITWH
jgi:hypothetical protein